VEQPSRNDPCPCDSGESYENCQYCRYDAQRTLNDSKAIARKHRKSYIADSFSGPQPNTFDHQGYTFRAIGSRLYHKKSHRTYIDFLVELIKFAFGPKWHKEQIALPEQNRHVIMQWMASWYRHCKKARPTDAAEDLVVQCTPTGDGQALLTLAHDLYKLQIAQKLSSKLMHRLRTPELFQGARYEVQVASIFLSSGFDIDWQEDNSGRHCEFYAVHRHTRTQVAVEAKSRKRPGVLGELGTFTRGHPTGIANLHEKARLQNPRRCPFCVFVDVNWPCHPELPKLQKPWMAEVFDLAKKTVPSTELPSNVSLSAFTNYSWHFQGPLHALPHETLVLWPRISNHPIDNLTFSALSNSIVTYGINVVESAPPMLDDEVLEQIASLSDPSIS
jgi:hypothetical protein